MLCRELSSFNWNGFVILRCLGSFWWHAYCQLWKLQSLDDFGLDRIWTCETEFEQFFDVSCHEFCTGFIFSAWHVYGFQTRGKPLWSVLQSCEGLCMHWQLVVIEFSACWHRSALFLFLSETLKFGWLHITCQDVRHASWGNSECDLYRKCESSVKVCVTHLRIRENEFVFGFGVVDLLFLIASSMQIGL